MKNKVILLLCLSVAFFMLGYTTGNNEIKILTPVNTNNNDKYSLLAKRLFVEEPNDPLINFTGLRAQLKNYMAENNLKGSLYFEYLPTGTNVRVDDNSEEVAASLMKIPATMELYKAYELGRVDIDKKIPLEESWLDDKFGELYKKGAGYELTLREAAEIALKDSDNTAIAMVIAKSRDKLELAENSLTYLDVEFSRPDLDTLTIGARAYSSFLKCLYFSCYLTTDNSQEILSYLTESSFSNRLAAGIPSGIKVAHKIGTFSDTQSDCGIVYEPARNYVLCVMLDVEDTNAGNAHIAAISKFTYDFVHSSSTK